MAKKTDKLNGEAPRQEVMVPSQALPLDLEKLAPAEVAFLRRVFAATGTAAAAAMAAETERHEQQRPEFYGTSPTDLTRQFSTLPPPRRGAGLPPRRP